MLRHPSRHYIYYLMSKRNRGVADIVAHLGDLMLPMPQKEDALKILVANLVKERDLVAIPPDFDPTAKKRSSNTEEFLARWRINDMWSGHPDVGRAIDLLEIVQVRRMLETLLLGPLSMGSIAQHVRQRFGLSSDEMNTGIVRAYSHYFWDYTALSTSEWRTVVIEWCPGTSDDYMMALLAPRTPGGAHLAVAAADRGGNSLDTVTQYATARDYSFRMFMQYALMGKPGLSTAQSAMLAFNMMRGAEEELDKRRGGGAELLEELKKIEAQHDLEKTKTVHELPVEPLALHTGATDKEKTDAVPDEPKPQ